MASLDSIFTKSNLEESKKKAKMLFGRLLINLRKTNHIKLYSLMESVEDSDLKDGVLSLILTDKTSFDMINNKSDIAVVNEILGTLQEGVTVSLSCTGKEPFDMFKFESRLEKEFGKLVTIKRK